MAAKNGSSGLAIRQQLFFQRQGRLCMAPNMQFLQFATVCICCQRVLSSSLSGTVDASIDDMYVKEVHVALFEMDLNAEDGLTKKRLLGADSLLPLAKPPTDFVVKAMRIVGREQSWVFNFSNIPIGNYTAVAFEPAGAARGNWLDFAPPRRQALGFFVESDGCSPSSFSDSVCAKVITITEEYHVSGIAIRLHTPHLMPSNKKVSHGSLHKVAGTPASVLHLSGTAYERGFAHGLVLAQQIIDMVDFFLVEDMVRSETFYANKFIPALQKSSHLTQQFKRGVEGLLAGMKASNHSLKTRLGSNISFWDIVALNTYSDAEAWVADKADVKVMPSSACSQFVFWGGAVSADLNGGTIAGRNMDGENDIRKLTVNNIVIHAIEPTEDDLHRYVHIMWPGFLGASSGFNQCGRYLMENAGCNRPGKVAQGSPVLRDVISSLLLDKSLGPRAMPSQVQSAILAHRSAAGGSCMNGCILVSAEPFNASADEPAAAGYIYEGDRYGGAMRLAADVPPMVAHGVMATNHYLRYQAIPGHPEKCNGETSSFSSLARYFAGQNKVEAWSRAGQLKVSSEAMKDLLRAVAHGTSEHSIIFKPNKMSFELAVASPNGVWDAPYSSWGEFSFDAMFDGSLELYHV